jgi:uncharacterized membrane protein
MYDEQSFAALDPMRNNVKEIARLEEQALHQRSRGELVSDAMTRRMGTLTFVLCHVAFFAGWVAANLGWLPGVPIFDPFPFGILTLIVSTEGVLLALFILISQNRMSRQADRRAHLNLQVSLLAEQELTLILQLQRRVCDRLGIDVHGTEPEADRLSQRTEIKQMSEVLDEQLPSG